MQNPFPDMNPYLEQPELWHQVHNWLIVTIAGDLGAKIAPAYRVSIEERIYTSSTDSELLGIADVGVMTKNRGEFGAVTTATRIEPIKVSLPTPEEVTERFLEVRATKTKELIAVIEVLSPKNKRSREGRDAYQRKREKILGSATHLVEIDLLRQGEPMPMFGLNSTHYRILISRGYTRPYADLYSFNLQNPIPPVPIPLRQGESEPLIELQTLLNEVYERGHFDLAVDYTEPIKPALAPEDADWVAQQLAAIDPGA